MVCTNWVIHMSQFCRKCNGEQMTINLSVLLLLHWIDFHIIVPNLGHVFRQFDFAEKE